jgi:pyocin large subunit-like protein
MKAGALGWLFEKHYFDHVINQKELSKLGIQTPKAYLQGAQKLISNPAVESVVRPDGRKMHFLKETSEFAVTQGDTIITYFIPGDGLDYWVRQLKELKKL